MFDGVAAGPASRGALSGLGEAEEEGEGKVKAGLVRRAFEATE